MEITTIETNRKRPGKVSELLCSAERWTKGFAAVNQNGAEVGTRSPHARRWCLYGACEAVYDGSEANQIIYSRLHEYLKDHADTELEFRGIGPWNDRPERSFADVRAVIEALDL